MGVVTGVLFFPLRAPVLGFRFLIGQLYEEAEAVLRDEGRAFAELIDLSMRHNIGQISDAEHATQETELLERLNSLREYRDELMYDDADESEEEW